jgi:hypothetical protein
MGYYDEMPYDEEELFELGIDLRDPRYGGGGHFAYGGLVDLEGKPVKRTKQSHPYNYDEHVVTRMRKNAKEMECAYTDRMFGWGRAKMERLTKKHMEGYRWDNCPGAQVEAFLREWGEDPGLELVAVVEWCNQATGYPTWSLHWVYSAKKRKEQLEKSRVDARARGCANWKCEKKFGEEEAVLVEGRGFPRYYCQGCVPPPESQEPG